LCRIGKSLLHLLVGCPPALQAEQHLAGGIQVEELRLGILEHRAHSLGQLPQWHLGYIPAVYGDCSLQHPAPAVLEQAVDELDDCGLSAAALSGQEDQFPRLHGEETVKKARPFPALVSIGHMVKGDHGSPPLQQMPPTHSPTKTRQTTASWMWNPMGRQ